MEKDAIKHTFYFSCYGDHRDIHSFPTRRSSNLYTNKHNHFKDEYLLFSQLAQKYEGSIDAVVEKLRNQHELGQNHLSDLSANLGGYERGESECVSKVRHHLSEFVRLMEVHIFAEDAVFFNMAKELMSQEEQDALQSGFEAYENGQGEEDRKSVV